MWVLVTTIVLVSVAAFTDWRRGEIPNWLTLPAIALAPVLFWWQHGSQGLIFSVLGIIGVGLVPYLMFRMDGMGGGDVKLFAALGALHGVSLGMEMLVMSLLVSAAWAIVWLARERRLGQAFANMGRVTLNLVMPRSRRKPVARTEMTEMRLGPSILVGSLLALWMV